jgi:hypothetical protein
MFRLKRIIRHLSALILIVLSIDGLYYHWMDDLQAPYLLKGIAFFIFGLVPVAVLYFGFGSKESDFILNEDNTR